MGYKISAGDECEKRDLSFLPDMKEVSEMNASAESRKL